MDTMDWVTDKNSSAYHTADEIVQKILNYENGRKHGTNGAIILMHLGTHRTEDFPHKKLPEIIQGLRDRGYELVKVTEMMAI
jgi:peptidoglycan/xylan/chitin deacetylase (PgdA/CDA1 family)